MKQVTTERHIIETVYQCEVCGARYIGSGSAGRCEEKHTCKHTAVAYGFEDADSDGEGWQFGVKGINSTCAQCGQEIKSIDFEDIDNNQKILERIFTLINDAT